MRRDTIKKLLIVLVVFIGILTAVLISASIYLGSYSRSLPDVQIYLRSTDEVKINKIENGYYFDGPGEESAIIFYPGAKVETTAYAPMLFNLAEQGVDCFLVEMPSYLAIFGKNEASKIIEKYNYKNWYMSGHSMGGAVAAMYTSENQDKISGLILLAAYPTKELSKDLKILSIYGDKDGVLNMDKYNEGKKYWNDKTTEIIINGGNHAQFGYYGKQQGDNDATITIEEQQDKVVKAILEFM